MRDALDARVVRGAIGLLIVVSVLPFPELEGRLRPLFLVLFGVELVLRVVVLTRLPPRRRGQDRRLAWAFVVIDLLAWLSFLPLEHLMGRQLLRGLRLVRLLVLVRFVRERPRRRVVRAEPPGAAPSSWGWSRASCWRSPS